MRRVGEPQHVTQPVNKPVHANAMRTSNPLRKVQCHLFHELNNCGLMKCGEMLPLIFGSQDCCHGVVDLVKSTRE